MISFIFTAPSANLWRLRFEFPDLPEAAPTTHDLLLKIGSDA